jgi:hypothetical protein
VRAVGVNLRQPIDEDAVAASLTLRGYPRTWAGGALTLAHCASRVTIHPMLRLRVGIEEARRRRWLGLFVVLLLAILVVFVVIHDTEHALEDAAALCLALAVTFSTLVISPSLTRLAPRNARGLRRRAPPAEAVAVITSVRPKPVPLRL